MQSGKRDKACVGSGGESTWRIKPRVSRARAWPASYFILRSLPHILEGPWKIISLEEPWKKNGKAFVVFIAVEQIIAKFSGFKQQIFIISQVAVGHEFGSSLAQSLLIGCNPDSSKGYRHLKA